MDQVVHKCWNNSTTAFLGLGSNLGNRSNNLDAALALLANQQTIKLESKSSYHENPAIEAAGPNDFLNAVIKIKTILNPYELLELVLKIELEIDPERNLRGRKAARKLDIDILTYGDTILNEARLTLPHPRMLEREFVMTPLAELENPSLRAEGVAIQSEANPSSRRYDATVKEELLR